MAKQSNNVVTHGLSGKVGDLLVFRQVDGKTVVANAPRKSKKVSESQLQHRKKFQLAVIYAQVPENQEMYKEKATKKAECLFMWQ